MSATEPRYCPISTLHRELRQGTGSKGRARATVTRRLCTIAGFYKYTVEEELLEHSPAVHVRRPRVDYESHAALDRNELGALLVAAGLGRGRAWADLAARAERAAGLRGHRRRHRAPRSGTQPPDSYEYPQGGKVATIPLAPHTARAIDLAIGERTGAPVFLAADGAAAGPARHSHRRRLRLRRRPLTEAPPGKAPPDNLNRRTELPAAADPKHPR
jgi:integrase/recombinase XerD